MTGVKEGPADHPDDSAVEPWAGRDHMTRVDHPGDSVEVRNRTWGREATFESHWRERLSSPALRAHHPIGVTRATPSAPSLELV